MDATRSEVKPIDYYGEATGQAPLSASRVSKALRQAGFLPVPWMRQEGISAHGGGKPCDRAVRVSAWIEGQPGQESRMIDQAAEALTAAGYTVERTSASALSVTRAFRS